MGPILIKLLKETLQTLILRVGWKIVVERFITRVVIWGLEELEKKQTNTVTKETLNDILASLKGKGLEVVEQKALNG
jgi:hypothetical protein